MSMRIGMSAVAVCVAIALAGCGSGTSVTAGPSSSAPGQGGAPPSTAPDQSGAAAEGSAAGAVAQPCSLLTAAEVQEAVGGGVTLTLKPDHFRDQSAGCTYMPTDPMDFGHEVSLVIDTSPEQQTAFDNSKNKAGNQAVSGLGDDAYFDAAAGSLSIIKRGAFRLDLMDFAKPARLDMLKSMAAKALGQLGS